MVDALATLAALEAFHGQEGATAEAWLSHETTWLREEGIELILADAPYLPW
jgi:hypothetical protein